MAISGTWVRRPRFFVSDVACAEERGHGHHAGCSFRIGWSINPYMRVGAADPERAKMQHRAFAHAITMLGGEVEALPFVHGAYDCVFAKDSAVVVHRGGMDHVLLASHRHAERRVEQRARADAFASYGARIFDAPPAPMEGGDVVVDSHGRGAFLGHGFRSSVHSSTALERFLDVPVLPLELRDPGLYHLDMAVAVLDDAVLVCEEALMPGAFRSLEDTVGRERVMRIDAEDARRFALNFVQIERRVLLASGTPRFERTLRSLGYEPHAVDLSEFQLAGGSAACLVSRCHVQRTLQSATPDHRGVHAA